jgi:hypothetical protein
VHGNASDEHKYFTQPTKKPTTPFSVPPVEKKGLDFFEICIEVITVAPVLNLTVSAE